MRSLKGFLTGLEDPVEIIRALRTFANSPEFARFSQATATKIVTQLFTDAGRTWRQAAAKNSKGSIVFRALMKQMAGPLGGAVRHEIERNAAIIRTLPLDVARQVNEHILDQTLKGTRASDIADQIQKLFPRTTEAKANLIARTETSKTSTALTQARSELLGIKWYVWRTSEDARVRESHQIMDGVIVPWSEPPSPEQLDGERSLGHYHAGGIFNCRCYAEPIIDLDLIGWPAKVYYRGSIQRMSRKQFEQIA